MLGITAAAPVAASAQDDRSGPALTAAAAPRQPPSLADKLARAQSYEYGEGLPRDQRLAATMYCEAAVAGSPEAAFRLGWMYANGRGVEHDDGTAVALFELAASEGHGFAKTLLQRMTGIPGMLPDCMRPVAPPDEPQVAALPDEGPDPFADLPPWKQKIADVVTPARAALWHRAAAGACGDLGRIELRCARAVGEGRAGSDATPSRNRGAFQRAQSVRHA